MKHADLNVIVTGGSGVVGSAIAGKLARPGNHIVVHCNKNEDAAFATAKEVREKGAMSHVIVADLSLTGEAERLIAEAMGWMAGLDILVHCASIFEKTSFGHTTSDQFHRSVEMNMGAPFFVAQAAACAMGDSGGKMIFLSDISARKPYSNYLPYCMAKAGVDALVRGLARSLAPRITVNAIAPYAVTRPGDISDEGWNDILNKTPMRMKTDPEEIAALAETIALSTKTMTGQIVTVDSGRILR